MNLMNTQQRDITTDQYDYNLVHVPVTLFLDIKQLKKCNKNLHLMTLDVQFDACLYSC